MAVVVEYMCLLSSSDSFCPDVTALTNLLSADADVSIEGNCATFGADFECEYAVAQGPIGDAGERFFHIRFSANEDVGIDLDSYTDFLKSIRTTLNKFARPPQTLWDDISLIYSRDAYEAIHRLENLMRKLITNFMLVNIGSAWVDAAVPDETKEVLTKGQSRDQVNPLHNVDFIDLSSLLLRPYSPLSKEQTLRDVASATSEEDLRAIQDSLPKSNWSRYFSDVVDCDDGYLRKKWEQLYHLRCKVAHNATVCHSDLNRVRQLVAELEPKLLEAIEKLPQARVPAVDTTGLTESAAEVLDGKVNTAQSVVRLALHQWQHEMSTPDEGLHTIHIDNISHCLLAFRVHPVKRVSKELHNSRKPVSDYFIANVTLTMTPRPWDGRTLPETRADAANPVIVDRTYHVKRFTDGQWLVMTSLERDE